MDNLLLLPPLTTLLESRTCDCHWPYGEGQEVCGRQVKGRGPYCEFHLRKSLRKYVPSAEGSPELTATVLSEIG